MRARPTKHNLLSTLSSSPLLLERSSNRLPVLEEQDGKYIIRVETPGIKQEALKVELVGRKFVVVSAAAPSSHTGRQTPEEHEPPESGKEESAGDKQSEESKPEHTEQTWTLRKAVSLPKDADIDALQVSYTDGVVRIEASRKASDAEAQADEETQDMQANIKRKRERLESLRRELDEERERVLEAEAKLKEAMAVKRQKIASERRQLTITQ